MRGCSGFNRALGRPGPGLILISHRTYLGKLSLRQFTSSSGQDVRATCLALLKRNSELSEEDARLEYGWIVSHVREEFANGKNTTGSQIETVRDLCARRAAGEPLQYILGEWRPFQPGGTGMD